MIEKIKDSIKSLYEKIEKFYYRLSGKIEDSYRTFKRFFRNLKLWYPVLKTDEQWDYAYLYQAMRHKLSLMEDFQRSDRAMNLHAVDLGIEIHKVIRALDRLIEDDYMSEDAYEYYSKLKFEDINKQDNKEDIMRWFEEEDAREKNDREFVFNYMKNNVRGWWD